MVSQRGNHLMTSNTAGLQPARTNNPCYWSNPDLLFQVRILHESFEEQRVVASEIWCLLDVLELHPIPRTRFLITVLFYFQLRLCVIPHVHVKLSNQKLKWGSGIATPDGDSWCDTCPVLIIVLGSATRENRNRSSLMGPNNSFLF